MPVKILETIRQGKIGGGETHVLDLVQSMDREEFEPVVLSFTPGPMVDQLRAQGVKTYVIHTTVPFNPLVVGKVKRLIREEGIELVHAHGTRATSNVYRAAAQAKVPMIYTVHGWSFHPSLKPWMFRLRHESEAFLTSQVDVTINVSQANQKEGRRYFPLGNSQIVYYGIDTHKFDPDAELIDLREEFGIPENKTLVGFVARMTTQKDPLTLVEAIRLVARQSREVHFLLVGDGELKAEVEARVKAYQLQDLVTFTGFRQDVPNVLHTLD
ncbi:MAG: glycosyltransferase, partial [Bacteroidota bacterium]